MTDLVQFTGIMDTDSPNETIGKGSIKMGRNICFRGDKGNWRIENMPGNTLIPYNQPTGVNECIGGFYDDIGQRIFEFIYNSNGTHSIRITYVSTLSRISLLTNGTSADSDCLDFTLDGKITEVKMLYGDEEQGDTLYFNNSSNEPCQINIERTLAGTYGTMTRDFLEVIKFPANRPPYVTFGDDATVTVNTFRKKLHRFMTRPVYFSREKSVVSIKSEIPLPINANSSTVDKDPTKNCKISIVYETLGADVESIEILGQVSGLTDASGVLDPNAFSDPFLIATLNKSDLSLNNNDIALFEFYNNQAYTEIDPEDAIQLFDLVPLEANALEMLNGKVPIYGGITEGFDLITLAATNSSSFVPEVNTQPPFVFVGSQSGDSAFGTAYLSGGINAAGVIHLILTGTIAVNDIFTVITTNNTLTISSSSTTANNALSQLSVAATSAGFTLSVVSGNNLYLGKIGEVLQMFSGVQFFPLLTNTPTYNWNDKLTFCINYFNKGGQTAGAQTIENLSVQTANYSETATIANIPQLLLSITHRPPIDAYYFTFGRTKSLAKARFRQWVSEETFKDSTYAYIGIENLNRFIESNKSDETKPSNSAFLAYDFATGDRIRFMKVLSGSVNTIYTNNDFEIVGQVLSPTINGVQRTGQYLKINLPTTSSTFDFGLTAFYNYFIELYTPAQSVANNLNKYYEFGERFTIGNPGTATRYHQGLTQNQTSNLSQPATFTFNKGDVYHRQRIINTGVVYKYNVAAYVESQGVTTMGVNFISQSYTDPNITPGSSPNQNFIGFVLATNTNRALLNISSGTYNFRAKGSIAVTFDFPEMFSYYLLDSSNNITYLVPFQLIGQGAHVFEFDVTFQMIAPCRLFIVAYSQNNWLNIKSYSETEINITRELPYTVSVMDANYSDYFASAVNSNGRPTLVQPESKRVYNPTMLRWGKPNIINTNINEVSRFTVLNFDEINLTKGAIKVLYQDGNKLEVLQERGCAWYAIYGRVLQSQGGENVITTTNEIINRNNVQNLAGNYGIGNNIASFTPSKLGYWFTDSIRGYQVRRSEDGLTPINELFFGQYTIKNIISKYNDDYIRPNGALSVIIGYYDYYEENYVVVCQGGTFDGNTIPSESFSFNTKRKAYGSFYDEVPEWIICAQDKTFEWRGGQIYIRNNNTDFGKRFGIQTYPSATLVFNDKVALKKTLNALGYQGNQYWIAKNSGDIITSQPNAETGLPQISQLKEVDFEINEGLYYAALLRDENSMSDAREALIEGDFLKGTSCQITLTYYGSSYAFLYLPYLDYDVSPRNF